MSSFHLNTSPFFSPDTATTPLYTLSLHDALPICADNDPQRPRQVAELRGQHRPYQRPRTGDSGEVMARSEEHTSELQSHVNLVCRLLLEKKKKKNKTLLPLDMNY